METAANTGNLLINRSYFFRITMILPQPHGAAKILPMGAKLIWKKQARDDTISVSIPSTEAARVSPIKDTDRISSRVIDISVYRIKLSVIVAFASAAIY